MSALPLPAGTKTATLTEVNKGILSVATDSFAEEQEWEFFCECGREDCNEYVSLTLDAYTALMRVNCPCLLRGTN